MSDESVSTCKNVSIAAPRVSGTSRLARTLRLMAQLVEDKRIEDEDVLDLTVSYEITEDGPVFSATVYWSED